MLLKVKGLSVKERLTLHEFTNDPPEGDPWGRKRPKHLITLGETPWPDAVKEDIAKSFKQIGVEDPLQQKLVEPHARAFGGKDNDGAYDLSGVDWAMVMDYFRWEAAAWDRDTDEKTAALDIMIAQIKRTSWRHVQPSTMLCRRGLVLNADTAFIK